MWRQQTDCGPAGLSLHWAPGTRPLFSLPLTTSAESRGNDWIWTLGPQSRLHRRPSVARGPHPDSPRPHCVSVHSLGTVKGVKSQLGLCLSAGSSSSSGSARSVHFICSVVSDSATPWTAARQAFLSFTISRSLLKLMSIELVMPSNHLILCCPLLLPTSIFQSIRVFSNESVLLIGVSASASVLPMNIQDRFPLGLTDWISLQSKGL